MNAYLEKQKIQIRKRKRKGKISCKISRDKELLISICFDLC